MRQHGFTLIEVIIVIVILGVLATLALPRVTGQIEAANAAEAMTMFGAIKRAFMNCMDMNNGYAPGCVTAAQLGVQVPTGSKFTYEAGGWPFPAAMFEANRMVNGVNNVICMCVDATPGSESTQFGVAPASSLYNGIVQRTGAAMPGNVCNGNLCGAAGNPY